MLLTAALRRQLRAAFVDHGGIEVDTQGDAFFVAFARASSAVAAAADGQRALAVGPIRVRMGLHTGGPRLTEEGYVGLDVHKGARIAAVGHGGQVLLSETTRALVDEHARVLGPSDRSLEAVAEGIIEMPRGIKVALVTPLLHALHYLSPGAAATRPVEAPAALDEAAPVGVECEAHLDAALGTHGRLWEQDVQVERSPHRKVCDGTMTPKHAQKQDTRLQAGVGSSLSRH